VVLPFLAEEELTLGVALASLGALVGPMVVVVVVAAVAAQAVLVLLV
jgi:hypothetical protein